MAVIHTCDLCGSVLVDWSEYKNPNVRIQIKKEEPHWFDGLRCYNWQEVDICNSCMNQIINRSIAANKNLNKEK